MRLKMDLPPAGGFQRFVVSFEPVPDFVFVPVNPASPLAWRYATKNKKSAILKLYH